MKLMGHEKPIVAPARRVKKGRRPDPNSITQQAIRAGLNPDTVICRVHRGMSLEEALTKPVMPQKESASLAGKASRAAARARRDARRSK
ncbi:hypothetical protein [Halomonas sp.]|uniref:hypothetical protein n=1 Tax=Halomonas sp. TaxID=1486246 RepID=UPI003D140716